MRSTIGHGEASRQRLRMSIRRTHRAAHPAKHLACFKGVLQVDGYNGFKRLAGDRADASVRLAFCWAHMRRDFYDFYVSAQVAACSRQLLARSERYMPLRPRSGAIQQNNDDGYDKNEVDRSWRLCCWLEDHLPRVSGASGLAFSYALRVAALVRPGRVPG